MAAKDFPLGVGSEKAISSLAMTLPGMKLNLRERERERKKEREREREREKREKRGSTQNKTNRLNCT